MILKVVTSNPGKVEEFAEAFTGLGIEFEHVRISYEEPQVSSLEEVVEAGIRELRAKGLSDFLIDDSGMFVDNLKGFPGVYSSYIQKTIGNDGVLKLMEGVSDRSAHFRCCIGCYVRDETIIVTGVSPGSILYEPIGKGGFGYDPIFSPDGKRSFAEMPLEEKNGISHRGRAIELLRGELSKRGLI
ncbi:MAG: RdgB/HAM1 family non-canonical purine NTP pyrophosphatase [Candidatus Methanomethylophilaceae archaeon]|nr:RdgB/HAM1 family non-canonical purine NTP pyrophosphatase [Candidatus Methanomethylophilaceae archaeon]